MTLAPTVTSQGRDQDGVRAHRQPRLLDGGGLLPQAAPPGRRQRGATDLPARVTSLSRPSGVTGPGRAHIARDSVCVWQT